MLCHRIGRFEEHRSNAKIVMLVLAAGTVSCFAGKPRLLELELEDTTVRGKMVARNQSFCWLMERDGNLRQIPLHNVTRFRKTKDEFRRMKVIEVRKELRVEFKKPFEIKTTQHYVVCARAGKAQQYARLFEDIYRTFSVHFSARGFRVNKPEFPLVAIVFPDFKSFSNYSQKLGIRVIPGLKGYYLPTTNRIALYDDGGEAISADFQPVPQQSLLWYGKVTGNLRDTLIHEATHQVAYNIGMHSRIGENPKWVVEGLATVFEAPGIRNRSRGQSETRINRARFLWFREFIRKRRKENSLADFIRSDTLFKASILDAYSQAWALSFTLIETRPGKYVKYLKKIAQRDPLKSYSPDERLADFKNAFGNDLEKVDASMLRYMKRLK